MKISNLRVEHHAEPLGIGEPNPRLSWSFEGLEPNWQQQACEIEVQRPASSQVDVFTNPTSQSLYVPWPATALASREIAIVRVRAVSTAREYTDWSMPLTVEVGLLQPEDWACSLIQGPGQSSNTSPHIPVLFRRTFELHKSPQKARLYISAQGVYESFINGCKIGDHVLAPGWTSYDHQLTYQTFDILPQLKPGTNVIGAEVAEGWFCGRLGFGGGERNIWGSTLGLIAQICITYDDSTEDILGTDQAWKYSYGPLLRAEIYDGEVFDTRAMLAGWNTSEFQDRDWQSVKIGVLDYGILRAPDGPPMRRIQEIAAKNGWESPSKKFIIDFGQNLVGWVRCKLHGPSGLKIDLIHAEVLENGECATKPLRQAKCTDTVILNGQPVIYEPRFTFHGFRYLQVDGWPANSKSPDIQDFKAVVVHTDMVRTGWFECSDSVLNRLHENVIWSMRGNFLSVPTDCPQRDERLGWTGDLQAFAPTACFLYNPYGMLRTWLRGLTKEQQADPSKVPPLVSPNTLKGPPHPAAVWGDSVVSIPWDLFRGSGDRALVADHYSAMTDWIQKGIRRDDAGGLWDPGHPQLGDWLEPTAPPDDPGNGPTDEVLVANAFLIRMTDLMAQISLILGREKQSHEYSSEAAALRQEFARNYITDQGRVVSDTQTALALSIQFSLFPNSAQEQKAASRLVHLIKAKTRFKIGTGFAGTPILGHALTKVGQTQLFYRMLFHKKCPSWLYPVTMGATTVWERWDSMRPDGTVNPSNMTSFNHYAFGAIANWMHSNIAGLQPAEPGWKKICIRPIPGGSLTSCHARFLSPYGLAEVKWKLLDGQKLYVEASVPGNTTAEITLPGESPRDVESGVHKYTVDYEPPIWPPLPIYPPFMPHDDDEP